MWRSTESGWAQGSTVSESLDLWRNGNKASDEQIQAYINKKAELDTIGQTDEMIAYQKDYDAAVEKDGALSAWFQGAIKSPSWASQMVVQSGVNLISSFLDGPGIMATVGAGSATAAGASAVAGTVGGPVGTAIGGVLGAAGGAIGTLSGIMETGLTLSEFINEELGGKKPTIENIRAIMADEEKFGRMTRRAVQRGIAIGGVDLITGGIVGKVVGKVGKNIGKKVAVVSGLGVDTVGGMSSELAGQLAGEQEINIQEILTEGLVDKSKAAISIPAGLAKVPKYSLNGESMSGYKFRSVINNLSDEDIAAANYDIKGDNDFKAIIDNRIQDLTIDSEKVDSKVNNEADRSSLINLYRREKEIGQPKNDLQKKKLKKIQEEISEISDKYIDSEVDATQESRKNSIKKARENRLMQNAEAVAKDLGFESGPELIQTDAEYKDRIASDQYGMTFKQLEKVNPTAASELSENNGVFLGEGKIIINKEVALEIGSVGVAAHEILHPILNALVGDASKQGIIVGQFKNSMTDSQLSWVQGQLNSRYQVRDFNGNIDVDSISPMIFIAQTTRVKKYRL